MAKRVRYHPFFDNDVIQAANWYDKRSRGLGSEFIKNARIATESVIADPESFGRTHVGLRYAPVERFPYLILFDSTDEQLLLLGVLHTARSMEKWRQERE